MGPEDSREDFDSGTDETAPELESRMREMYSRIRYPRLNPEANDQYVRHRRFVYSRLGIDVERFFKSKTILDAGCGTGEETLFLASLGPEKVIGVDTSEGSLEYAKESAAKLGVNNVEFRYGSVLDTDLFADGTFDYISSLGCIHHTPDTHAAFVNLCRMVKPGGRLCTFIYNSFGHAVYNLQCSTLDLLAGNDIDNRVKWARRLFALGRGDTMIREGVPSDRTARLYDKYGVLYRDSITLETHLKWYREQGFTHEGSFPMYLRDIIHAYTAAAEGGTSSRGVKGTVGKILNTLLPKSPGRRHWTFLRRSQMQKLLLLMGIIDYGSAFRILGRKSSP